MEGTVIMIKNRYALITPNFKPGSLLRDSHGNIYLVITSESSYERYIVRALDAIKEIEEEMRKGKIDIELGILPENTSKAVIIGEIVVHPNAGEKVRLVARLDELTSEEDAVITPFGGFDPWKGRMTHITIFGRTGVGKSVLLLALVLLAVRKGYKAVILDYHGEYKESVGDFIRMGYRVVYHDLPKVNICRTPPEVLAAVFGILPVLDRAPKMMRYMQMIAKLACEAPQEVKEMFEDAVDLIKAIAEAIILVNYLDAECDKPRIDSFAGGKRTDDVERKMCRLKNYIRERLTPFEYNMLKNLVKDRDRESLESLYRYMAQLDLFRGIISLDEDIALEGYDIVIVNLSIALSQISFAIPIAIHVINKVFTSPEKIVLFVEEAPALMASDYIRASIENLVRQGRKFNKFVVIVTQAPLEVMSQTNLIIGNIANSRYIKEVMSRVPHMSDALRFVLPIIKPWTFIYIDTTGNIVPVKILRKVAKHSASEV